uniref:non-specific serine/threonine protein kinase n=1 Tax=Eptatretus burgeri TaxID=7764 RepID=A0A8C4R3E1_EPTBU
MPSQMEDYQVLNTIGWGSYGECQKILRKSDEKVLVWKVLDYGTMTEAEKQKLVSEVNLLRELKHPNIVRYYDRIIDRSNATLYIVMEYCEGGDLANLIASYRRDRYCTFAESNRCWNRKGNDVLVDLHTHAFCQSLERTKSLPLPTRDKGTTFSSTFTSTPFEQFCCMSYNEKSDIWSLGCLLYELCSLMPPFTGSNQKQLAEKIKEGRFKKIPLHFSDELNHVISRMLHLKDYLRPSIEQLLQCDSLAEHAEEAEGLQMSPDGVCCSSPLRDVPDEKYRLCEDDRSVLQKKEDRLLARELAMREREERLKRTARHCCFFFSLIFSGRLWRNGRRIGVANKIPFIDLLEIVVCNYRT